MELLAQLEVSVLVDWAVRISVPILIAVLTGIARVVWTMNQDINHLRITKVDHEEFTSLQTIVRENSSDTAVLKSNQIETSRRLERMEDKLDQLLER